ncbi:hypothetical protein [Metabacillus sp. 84]|uniref:hypothetical protein n=1 Tax=Metabacillus sp. 84 TaxID=3404705 RepID=UPI003CE9D8A2
MRYKWTILLIFSLAAISLSIYFSLFGSNIEGKDVKIDKELFTELQEQQLESSLRMMKSWGDENLYSPSNAMEGSKDEYVSYYAYQTADLLGENPHEPYCRTVIEFLKNDSFADEEDQLIFTGIERVYRADQSLSLCSYEASQSKAYMEKHVQHLLDTTYIPDGYFISNEFKEYRDKPGYELVKVQQTRMMLNMASKYGFMEALDQKAIRSWVKSLELNELQTLEAAAEMNQIMGIETARKIPSADIDKLIHKRTYDFNDLMDLNSLAALQKLQPELLQPDEMAEIAEKVKKQFYGLSDIQSEYLKMNLLHQFHSLPDPQHKDMILKDLSVYRYEDGMLPSFSTYDNQFSPVLIGKVSEEYAGRSNPAHDEAILKRVLAADIDELMKQDPFEVYSFVSLLSKTGGKLPDEKKEALNAALLKKMEMPIVRSSMMGFTFYAKALKQLNGSITKEMLPPNTEAILNEIIQKQASYFGEKDQVSSLAFLETLSSIGLYTDQVRKAKPFADQVKTDPDSEIGAYLIYYKAALMHNSGMPYDQNKTGRNISQLYKRTGYALNSSKSFPDIYSTYFLMAINHNLTEDFHHES